jgi:hypothetical protein
MGTSLDRRQLLLGSTAAVGCATLGQINEVWAVTRPDDHRVGPMPHLPPLPPRPYPYRAPVLFTNGSIAYIDGYVVGLSINRWLSRGLASMIPHGLASGRPLIADDATGNPIRAEMAFETAAQRKRNRLEAENACEARCEQLYQAEQGARRNLGQHNILPVQLERIFRCPRTEHGRRRAMLVQDTKGFLGFATALKFGEGSALERQNAGTRRISIFPPAAVESAVACTVDNPELKTGHFHRILVHAAIDADTRRHRLERIQCDRGYR